MIQITPHMRILVAREAIDFRAGIDGLASLCRQRLEADPFSGSLFVFRNRARTAHSAPNSAEPKAFLSGDLARHRAWIVARYA